MATHKDTFRSKAPTKKYRDNHDRIFGPATGTGTLTQAEIERRDDSRKHTHALQAERGERDADWYMDNERRVPADPDYVKKPYNSQNYRDNYDKVFKK